LEVLNVNDSPSVSKVSETLAAAPTPPADGRTFGVLLSNRAHVEAGLVALAKRYARRGLTLGAWSWGKAVTRREHHAREYGCVGVGCGGCLTVSRVPLTLAGDAPQLAGWTFVAALEHLDGENLVRSVVGQESPAVYRTRGPTCDHCRTARRRSETYVLRHEDGHHVQVGSTCVEDFTGSDSAGKLARSATLLAAARALAEEGCEGFGASSSGELTLSEYLPVVAWCVRAQGWVSRTAAREAGHENATADRALTYRSDPKLAKEAGCVVSPEDVATAEAAETWAESLTDAQVDAERGDYLHNLRAVARSGMVNRRSAGVGASAVVAYQRAIAKERARAEQSAKPDVHTGVVGKRQVFACTLEFVTGYETDYGYTTVLKLREDSTGALLVWKSTNSGATREDVGKRYNVKGTVKKHDEYKGVKQTMVSRCVLEEVK
jgi:hypothetical protein